MLGRAKPCLPPRGNLFHAAAAAAAARSRLSLKHHLPSYTCASARLQPHSAEIRRWRRQSVQMGRKICFVRADAIHGETFPAESGTLPHRPWTPMSLVNGRVPASEALREGWSEAEVCAEELPLHGGLCTECPGGSPCGSIGKQLRVSKSGPGAPDC